MEISQIISPDGYIHAIQPKDEEKQIIDTETAQTEALDAAFLLSICVRLYKRGNFRRKALFFYRQKRKCPKSV